MCPQRFTSHPTNPSNPSIHPKCHYMALWVPVSKNGEYLFTQTSPQNSGRDKHYQNIKYGEMNTEQACLSIFTKFHPPQILTLLFLPRKVFDWPPLQCIKRHFCYMHFCTFFASLCISLTMTEWKHCGWRFEKNRQISQGGRGGEATSTCAVNSI